MKKIASFLILCLLILFAMTQFSYARPDLPVDEMDTGIPDDGPFAMGPPMMPCNPGSMKEMPGFRDSHWMRFQDLHLDEKQEAAIREVGNIAVKEFIKKRADELIAEIELRELLEMGHVDLKAVESKLKQLEAIKTELLLIHFRLIERMKAKLTSEQSGKLKKLRSIHHPRMRQPWRGDMMNDETKPQPSTRERGK